MGHCKPEEIEDLRDILKKISQLENIKEKGFGKIYLKSKGFLHFHSKDGRRWADVRDGIGWGAEIEIPFNASKSQIDKFTSEVKKRHKKTSLLI